MAKRINGGLQIDYKHLKKTLDAIGRVALPFAAAEVLNKAAFDAQAALTAATASQLDRPTKFTQSAFIVTKAKPGHGERMFSVVQAKRIQAAYLRLQIEGGTRTKDNAPGGGPYDIVAYGIRTTKFGGIPKGLTKALSIENKQEQRRREAYATFRKMDKAKRKSRSLIDAGITESQWGVLAAAKLEPRRDPATGRFLKTDNSHYKKMRKLAIAQAKDRAKAMSDAASPVRQRAPSFHADVGAGLFFGVIKGSKGYWRRPKERGGKLVPLALFKTEMQYKPRFKYREIIEASYDLNGNREAFARALDREVRFQVGKIHEPLDAVKSAARTFGPWQQGSRTPYGIAHYSQTVRRPDFLKNTPSPWKPTLEFRK